VARALAGGKPLVLADEPTGSLDSATSHEIFALLRSLADQGVAIVMASHDPSFADFADIVYDIRDGILTRIPAPAEGS
jgi:putative ABC transport system ATP-binding protein